MAQVELEGSLGLVSQVARATRVVVHRVGGLELVAGVELVRFLDGVRTHGLRVLGLEGFRVAGSRLVPDRDAIADFSSIPSTADCEETIAEAMRFALTGADLELFYEVTLDGDPAVPR